MTRFEYTHRKSERMYSRASSSVAGGIWGHNKYPGIDDFGSFPLFASRAKGAYFWDVDGNRYIDYLCGSGSMITGFANEKIDNSAIQEMRQGSNLSLAREASHELAEKLQQTILGADWVAYGRNGSDAVTIAVLIARAATGRRGVVSVEDSYHGSHFWCNWSNFGPGQNKHDSGLVRTFRWNDLDSVSDAVERFSGDISSILIPPFHHPIPGDSVLAAEGFFEGIQEIAASNDCLIILDDIRAGFRTSLRGSHQAFGFRPHLMCYSKALANTHSLAVTCGVTELRSAAEEVFISGTYRNDSPSMKAAIANLELMEQEGTVAVVKGLGEQLATGLRLAAKSNGFKLRLGGIPAMPSVRIHGDSQDVLMRAFAVEMAALGSFVHPRHNWFLSSAHSTDDIETTIRHAHTAFEAIRGHRE